MLKKILLFAIFALMQSNTIKAMELPQMQEQLNNIEKALVALQQQNPRSGNYLNLDALDKIANNAAQVTGRFAQLVDTVTQSYKHLPLMAVCTIAAGFSAYSLTIVYPRKAIAERTRRDWAIPATGLGISVACLIALNYR